ncbi:hypothetical protein GOP47_0028756 [Adiantum capillus-veneris]|nr:hypothetical protein GOP47_0028756 [Adiantum capillus-veneris]
MSADSWTINGAASPSVLLEVMILHRDTVLPTSPSISHPLLLSCLDIIWQDIHYNQRLLFYPHPCALLSQNGADDHLLPAMDLMQQLKSSLAVCLVHTSPGVAASPRVKTLPTGSLLIATMPELNL